MLKIWSASIIKMCKLFSYLVVLGLISTAYSDGLCKYEDDDCVPRSACSSTSAYQTCGTDSRTGDVKVCCPTVTVRFPNKGKSKPKKDPYAIAKEKCDEYSEARYVVRRMSQPNPLKPPIVIRTLECPTTTPLIVNGQKVLLKEFPHMALIGFSDNPKDTVNNTRWACGGTLISDRFVLTAAHCGRLGREVATWVRLGELIYDDDSDSARPKDFRIAERIPHHQYNTSLQYFDIMLLKLEDRVQFTPHMRPICLGSSRIPNQSLHNESIIAGWGKTNADESLSDTLLKAKVYFADDKECIATYRGDKKLVRGYDSTTMICAGNKVNGTDTCMGDSGGPLKVAIPDERCIYLQVGITSYGSIFCGNKAFSSIYTKISPFIPWIQSIVWP